MTTVEIGTLVIALYGAVLSTVVIWQQAKQQRYNIKVKASSSYYGYGSRYKQTVEIVTIEAANHGVRTINLTSGGILLPDGELFPLPNLFPSTVIDKNEHVKFPYELTEGSNCRLFVPAYIVADAIKNRGIYGVVPIKAYFHTALGKRHISKKIVFDVEGHSEDIPIDIPPA